MTRDRDLKFRIRARMQKTGESYAAARRQFLAQGSPDGANAAPAPLTQTVGFAIPSVSPVHPAVFFDQPLPAARRQPIWVGLLGVLALVTTGWAGLRGYELRERALEQRAVAEVVRNLGGAVRYDWQAKTGALATQADDWNVNSPAPGEGAAGPAAPDWLRRMVGDEYFQEIKAVTLFAANPSDAELAALGRLASIESINLHGSQVSDEGLAHLASLPRLRRLALAMGSIGDSGLRQVARMKNLEVVTLDRTAVSDSGVAYLAGLEHLRELTLSHTGVTDAAARSLQNLSTLETLALDNTRFSEAAAADVRRHLPHAKVLHPRPEDSSKC